MDKVSVHVRESCRWTEVADKHNHYCCKSIYALSKPGCPERFGALGRTNAVVAAKHSALPALAMTANTTENRTVKATTPPSLARGERMK
jgi:hypothetical protein